MSSHYIARGNAVFVEECVSKDKANRRAAELNTAEVAERRRIAREVIRDIAFFVRMSREADAIRLLDQYSLNQYKE